MFLIFKFYSIIDIQGGENGGDDNTSNNGGTGESNNNNGGGNSNNNGGGNYNNNEGNNNEGDDSNVNGAGGNDGNYYSGNNNGGDGDSYAADAYSEFDITECDTYANLWMWDLSLTCDDADTFDNCECTFAEDLMEDGYLSCSDIAMCPQNCDICSKCLKIAGCIAVSVGGVTITSDSFPYYVLAIVVTAVVGATVAYTKVRQERNGNDLDAHLMEDDARGVTPHFGGGCNESQSWLVPAEPQFTCTPEGTAAMPIVPVPIIRNESSVAEYAYEEEEGPVWLAPAM